LFALTVFVTGENSEEEEDQERPRPIKKIVFRNCRTCGALGHFAKGCKGGSPEYEGEDRVQAKRDHFTRLHAPKLAETDSMKECGDMDDHNLEKPAFYTLLYIQTYHGAWLPAMRVVSTAFSRLL